MPNKALYKTIFSGDLFAIETNDLGDIISTAGPLLTKDIDPETLDYDNYWSDEVKAKIKGFELLSNLEYKEILFKNGFYAQRNQKHLW